MKENLLIMATPVFLHSPVKTRKLYEIRQIAQQQDYSFIFYGDGVDRRANDRLLSGGECLTFMRTQQAPNVDLFP